MDESGGEGIRDRISARGEEALGDLSQFLAENPWLNQALQVAFEARDRAAEAGASAIRNLNLPTAQDVDRMTRRVRSLSERLEEVEDQLDRVTRELAELRRERDASPRGPADQGPV